MGKIRILPDYLCHHIAAGEVVERPAAVVKELVENSLDAGSSHISVFFDRGGIKLIRVVDNGEGMDREDALLALERHATSKIKTLEDLHNIKSFGFRGEALASISAVSRFELLTKTAEEEIGTKVSVEGGIVKSVEPYGCPVGCAVTVRDLFFNVPARRKFLKSENTERQHILDQLRRLAIVNYRVHFELYEGQNRLWNYPKTESHYERLAQVFNLKPFQHLLTLSLDRAGTSIKGYVGDVSMGRPNSSSVFLFINGRPFRDALIQKALREACRSFLPEGIFPFAVLFIEMDPRDVDVNVHPTKQEVRFKSISSLIALIKEAVSQGMGQLKSRYSFSVLSNSSCQISSNYSDDRCPPKEKALFLQESINKVLNSTFPSSPIQTSQVSTDQVTIDHRISFLGILGSTYIVCSSPEGLVLIDFHAAHERIIYNDLMASSLPLPSQRLALPMLITVAPEEVEAIERKANRLLLLGYEMEAFGKDTVAVRAIPSIGLNIRHEEIIGDIMRIGLGDDSDGKLLEKFASTVACHAALRAGTTLSEKTISWLLKKLSSNPQIFTCPHGRPVWITITFQEIDKRFGRNS